MPGFFLRSVLQIIRQGLKERQVAMVSAADEVRGE
jgi:hypothetical protein